MDTARRRWLGAVVAAALLGGCGFHLRGDYALPFSSLQVGLPEAGEFYAQLRRAVEASSATRVVAAGEPADARLVVLANQQSKNVLSLSAAGRVREFELVRTFKYRVLGKDDVELSPPATIIARRDITYSDEQVLSKEVEENLLWADMQADVIQQLLRRLAAVRPRP